MILEKMDRSIKSMIVALKHPYIEKETGIVSLEAILRKIFNKDNE